tara:strand:+ start:2131 stop:2382 length:252 start_codon:yes stop_codon:yes gene_type:complete
MTHNADTHKQCSRCEYAVSSLYKGYCEYCRYEFGKHKAVYAQSEDKSELPSDQELEEMTDGDFINKFGNTKFVSVEDEMGVDK